MLQILVRNREKGNTNFLWHDRIVFVAGRAWAVRVDSGGNLWFLYSIVWS